MAPAPVLHVTADLLAMGCSEVSLGDTIGRARVEEVERLLDVLLPRLPAERLALHLHDTFGAAVANAQAGAAMGIRTFDGSTGGLGGCPYAPGAPGNVATEALVDAFAGHTGVDPATPAEAAALIRPYLRPQPDQDGENHEQGVPGRGHRARRSAGWGHDPFRRVRALRHPGGVHPRRPRPGPA